MEDETSSSTEKTDGRKKRRKKDWEFIYNKNGEGDSKKPCLDINHALSFSLHIRNRGTSDISDDDASSNLVIDDSENEDVPKVLDEMEEEIERQLEEKAEKTNLSVTNVKNILRAVITDRDVMDMVKYTLNKGGEKPKFEPKLTRAKTRELLAEVVDPLWKVPQSYSQGIQGSRECMALLQEELSEDSSDEEYQPQDETEVSDAETKDGDNSILDSEPPTPATPGPVDEELQERDVIGTRTRSKLCLEETPLEEIEQLLVPPDITTDMYDTECDNQDWVQFLKEFTQPLPNDQQETCDDDNDPEYNFMVDEEVEGIDMEELRQDRAVKVTKKEFNDLMAELFEYTENLMRSEEEETPEEEAGKEGDGEEVKGSQEPGAAQVGVGGQGDMTEAVQPPPVVIAAPYVAPAPPAPLSPIRPAPLEPPPPAPPPLIVPVVTPFVLPPSSPLVVLAPLTPRVPPKPKEPPIPPNFSRLQYGLFQQQFRQHVQLTLQNCLLCYGYPGLGDIACAFKEILVTLHSLSSGSNPAFSISNLESALKLVRDWEDVLSDPYSSTEVIQHWEEEERIVKEKSTLSLPYHPRIPHRLIKLCLYSDAFLYPLLLPKYGFPSRRESSKHDYISSEYQLIAIGLEEYHTFVEPFTPGPDWMYNVTVFLYNLLLRNKTRPSIESRIKFARYNKKKLNNPVMYFFKNYKAPDISHFMIPLPENAPILIKQPLEFFPSTWSKVIVSLSPKANKQA